MNFMNEIFSTNKPKLKKKNTQIKKVYVGSLCTFWGYEEDYHIDEYGLVVCPHCENALIQVQEEIDKIDYSPFLKWRKGKCFKTEKQAERAYKKELKENEK